MVLAAQLLVQALVISRLDYCNALLALVTSTVHKQLVVRHAVSRYIFIMTVVDVWISFYYYTQLNISCLKTFLKTKTDSCHEFDFGKYKEVP